ncbi:MAG: insulinase family protein [Acidobacteria bacterium]|nr:insulinase family protein [Acidobacteriota bacterium]MBV9477995.1 insulinase family protein [Acidobacteriota bacterium]
MKRALLALLFALPLVAQEPTATTADTYPATPPAPLAPREATIPQPSEKTLANGLRVIVVEKHSLPLVAARLLVKTGGAADPASRAGLASLTAGVLTKGTKTRSAEEIARGVESLGATLESDATWDSSLIDVSMMAPNLAKTMEYVADVARNATFAKDELERERAQAIDSLQVELSEPRTVANIVASRLVFGTSAYGHNLSGTPASLGRITRDDLVQFHKHYYRPDNAVLLFAGDVRPSDAFALAEKLFGSWSRGSGAPPSAATKFAPQAPRAVVIDMPAAGQAAVVLARPGIRRVDPQYMPAAVLNSILGGGFSSRLNQEIRIKRGLSYGAGSSFEARADVGPFTARAETKNESAAEVAGLIGGELSRLATTDVEAGELTPRKAALIGDFAESLETTRGLVNRLGALARYGLPLADINRYIGGVQAVTAQDVRKFANASLAGSSTLVIVGDAKQFIEPLRAQTKDVEVIPLAELDLDSPTLRVRKKKD